MHWLLFPEQTNFTTIFWSSSSRPPLQHLTGKRGQMAGQDMPKEKWFRSPNFGVIVRQARLRTDHTNPININFRHGEEVLKMFSRIVQPRSPELHRRRYQDRGLNFTMDRYIPRGIYPRASMSQPSFTGRCRHSYW